MVDYILKIDIDESDLVRKLKNALKKADMFSGGGSGMGAIAGGGGAKAGIEKGLLTEPAMKRINEYAAKQTAFREGQANTLLLDNELKMGRKADAHGKTMERMGAMQHNWQKKMFNIGTVVKLAGLATGVAGLLQMRKMVIDSSPMLQAMLKLLNVGIMFILRPIGDFFGFVLRPLLVPFILLASQFYASRLGLISEVGTDAGQALVDQDILKFLDRFSMILPILLQDPEKTTEELDKRKLAEAEGTTFWDDIYNIMKLVNPQLQIFKLQIAAWQKLFSLPNPPAEATGGAFGTGSLSPSGAEYYGPGGAPGEHEGIDFSNTGDTAPTSGTNYKIKLQESLGISDSGINTSVEPANDPFANKETQENWMEIERQLEELNQESLQREFNRLIEVEHKGLTLTQEVIDLLKSNETKEEFWSGGFTKDASNDLIDDYQNQLESAEARRDKLEAEGKSIKAVTATIEMLNEMIQEQHDNIAAVNGKFKDLSNTIEQTSTAISNIFTASGSQGTFTYGSGSSGSGCQISPYTGLTATQAAAAAEEGDSGGGGDPNAGKTLANCGSIYYAGGGVISEEIYGIGKCSGKKYRFGEKGDEAIIPMNCFNSLVGGMGRIGISSMIGQRNVTGGAVGNFTGISASRYSRYASQLGGGINLQNQANEDLDQYGGAFEGAQQQYAGEAPAFYCKAAKGFVRGGNLYENTSLYQSWLDDGGADINADLKQAATMISEGSTKLSPYAGTYSDEQTVAAISGQKSFEGGSTTNLGGLTINVSGATDTDSIIDEIGPKLLKYLQENEARAGIR